MLTPELETAKIGQKFHWVLLLFIVANAQKEALLQNTTVDMIQVKRPMVITYIQQVYKTLKDLNRQNNL